jgi:basic amino acid/polyamine antiporter, APA family
MAQIGDPSREKSLGIAACTAIVVGNMVGSGFYLSPPAVAPYGTLAIVVWVVMGAGAICLGLTFAKLARLRPETGGPYAYTRIAYGDFPGFLIAWVYWISIWASLPVIAVAFAGAIIDMFPGLHSRIMATVLTLGGALGCGAHQSARRQGGRPLCRADDLFENDTVWGDRDYWFVLRRSDAFQ